MSRNILVVSQVYAPDPAAVARLMSDVGAELARRGNRITVLTSDRGYDDPSVKYPTRSASGNIEIRRLPFSSFGKRSMAVRVMSGLSFTVQAAFRGLLISRLDTVVVSTSPPMASLAAVIVGALRRVRVVYWPMDLNPDQAVALGLANRRSFTVRLFEWLNRTILERATIVVALDRAMARRLQSKRPIDHKLVVVPPWPEEDDAEPVPHEENPFRRAHGLAGKTVIMYSGTLGPSNPVDTLLAAAEQFESDPQLVFLFVGGGTGMEQVRARNRPNVRCLPYEPLERMRFSLSAGDVHVVSLGDGMAGIVHPCKVYGAMSTARPILYLGPSESHVTEMMAESDFGWHVPHGDVAAAVAAIRAIIALDRSDLEEMGDRARTLIQRSRTRTLSRALVCDAIEAMELSSSERRPVPRPQPTSADDSLRSQRARTRSVSGQKFDG